eukprot:5487713-Amphidinium_carterae.2
MASGSFEWTTVVGLSPWALGPHARITKVGRCAYHGAKARLSAQGGAVDEPAASEEQSKMTAELNGVWWGNSAT